MRTGAGAANNPLGATFKDVAFTDDRVALVSDADVVVAMRPPAPDVIDDLKEGTKPERGPIRPRRLFHAYSSLERESIHAQKPIRAARVQTLGVSIWPGGTQCHEHRKEMLIGWMVHLRVRCSLPVVQ
jgi:hypothetical protein